MFTETREIPQRLSCDVLVCGGGIAGIAAALAAARQGKKTVLIDRGFMLGGLGTAGLITIYLPLCDGLGHQVSFGIAEELLRLSVSYAGESHGCFIPDNWMKETDTAHRGKDFPRFETKYNPQLYAILCEQLLLKEGVTILYGTYGVSTVMNGDKIKAVIVESKSGREAIVANSVVDATGDADIASFCGVPCATFQQGNLLAAWYYGSKNDSPYYCQMVGVADVPEEEKDGKVTKGLIPRRFTGLDCEEISQFVQLSHEHTLKHLDDARKNGSDVVPSTIATIPQLRMTRHICGETQMSEKDDHVFCADSVGMIGHWYKRGPVYEVPFSSLYSARCKNLITAGRCTSVTESMWNLMRVIPCCAVSGEAAGTAAAMTDDFSALPVADLQAKLTANGVRLHWEEIVNNE